jgi:signal transduction histidine kinase/ABC-type uncharacterized transport system substrate-binding protein
MGLSWTDGQTKGIIDVVEKYDDNCTVFVEYMDWKNYPTEDNLKNVYNSVKYKYAGKKIDVVITTDDAALDFALKSREELFADTPIVFCGVNEQGITEITHGYSQFTGVMEIIDPKKTIEAALQLNPNLKEIYVLFDNTESGISTGEITIKAIRNVKSSIKINKLNDKSVKDVLDEVGRAVDDSIVLITTYYRDPDGNVVGFEDFSRIVSESSRVPVFHLYDFGLNNGVIGGCIISSRLQGEAAGKIAIRIMEGEDVYQIPLESSINTNFVFDYQKLTKFNIPLERVPAGSVIINKPFSFFETYRSIVIIAITIFCLLIIFIIMQSIYLGKIGGMKNELEKEHEMLIDSDNKLRQQFNELTTTQQQLISSEVRYSLLFEKMMNAFCIVEPVLNKQGKLMDIRFITANPGFRTQLGMDAVEITGKTWVEVYKYPNKNLEIYHDVLSTGKARHFDTYYPNTNIYYSANAFKISDNQIGVVFNNITEYKQAIKEITKLNDELEQRVVDRTEELQSAVNELEAFTYTVSHDLKSPLRAVDGYIRIMREDFEPKLGEEGEEIISNISLICSDMIEMISKLLKYSTASNDELCKEEINIEERFQTIYKELIVSNPGRNIKLIIETGLPIIFADKVMIRQVIYNILSNSIKFTQNKESAIITVGCTITGEEYIFYIKDNGVGFDMDYSGRLFRIFQRLHTNDEFEGSGIGLVTVKKIIQRHGGRVWIKGKVDAGVTVYFTVPFSQ